MNNILFLDFDGPMFNEKSLKYKENQKGKNTEILKDLNIHPFFHYWKMDEDMVNMINYLSNDKNFKLVISSSWANSRMNNFEQIKKLLEINDIQAQLHLNYTSQIYNATRVEQIKYWLINNKNINKYFVLDDFESGWSLTEQNLVENVYLCDENNGFSIKEINEFKNFFENKLTNTVKNNSFL